MSSIPWESYYPECMRLSYSICFDFLIVSELKNYEAPELLLILFPEYVQFHKTNDISDSEDNVCSGTNSE